MDTWKILATISTTINCMLVVYFVVKEGIRLLWKRKKSLTRLEKCPINDLDDFVKKHRGHLAALFVDTLVDVGLFACSMYLLTAGQLLRQPFTIQSGQNQTVSLATVVFSVSIGRHIVCLFWEARRMRVMVTPASAAASIMQITENVVALISLGIVVSQKGNFFTGTMILLMCIDQNAFSLHIMLDKLDSRYFAKFRFTLKILQCFLSIAFRCAVPMVCFFIATFYYDNSLFHMTPMCTAIFMLSLIFYLGCNCWTIFNGVKILWFSIRMDPDKLGDSYFATRMKSPETKIPLGFQIVKNDLSMNKALQSHIYSLSDLDNYLDQDQPPPYKGYCRKVQNTSRYTQPSLHVPEPVNSADTSSDVPSFLYEPSSDINVYQKTSDSSSAQSKRRDKRSLRGNRTVLSPITEEV